MVQVCEILDKFGGASAKKRAICVRFAQIFINFVGQNKVKIIYFQNL